MDNVGSQVPGKREKGKIVKYSFEKQTIDLENIPQELKTLRQWIVWVLEPNPEPEKKPRKIPYRAFSGKRKAETNNPETWGTFEQAVAYHQSQKWVTGIGFVFSGTEFVAVDLDDCLQDGKIEPWAQEIMNALSTYTEVSQSRTGLHFIAKGKLPAGSRRKGKVEMYDASSPRYFVMTGKAIGGRSVESRQAEIEAVHAKYLGEEKKKELSKPQPQRHTTPVETLPLDDYALLEKARAARNGGKFSRLWGGDTSGHGQDHSASDLALCGLLAFWTQNDAAQMDRLFRSSGLMRDKWDKKHHSDGRTYGQGTIEKAIADCREVYEPQRPGKSSQEKTNGRSPAEVKGKANTEIVSTTSPTKKLTDSRSTAQGVFNLVASPTSAGKTVFAAQSMSEDIKANDAENDTEDRPIATYLTDTKKNINDVGDHLLSLGISEEDFSIQISGVSTVSEADADEDEEDPDNEQGTEPIRKGNLGHYHWLGLKGHLPETFAVAGYTYEDRQGQEKTRHGLTTAQFLYLDEFHTIFDICTIEHDLCMAYIPKQLGQETWVFPTDQFQGPGTQFFFHWPVRWKYQKYEYKGMPKVAMDINTHYLKPKNLDFLGHTFEELQNPAIYKQVYKTLFVLDLPQATIPDDLPPRLSKAEKKNASEYDYLLVLYPYLYKPQIQIEFPIMRESGQPISLPQLQKMFNDLLAEELQKIENDEKYQELSPDQKEEAKKTAAKKARQRLNELIIKPAHAAYVPRLCGYNLLPFIQILRFPSSINAFSATMDEIQIEILQYVCNLMGWQFQLTVIDQAPIRFPVRMLSLRQQIALPDLSELLLILANDKIAKSLVVSWKKVNVNRLWELLDKTRRKLKLPQAILKEFCRFISGGHHTNFIDAYKPDSNLLTYDGASILQGGNLPYHNLGIFDCGLWIRRAILCIRCKELTTQEIDLLMNKRIVVRLTQMSGRLFRDEVINALRRQHQAEGKEALIYQSSKTIIILLHNHADVLADFAPDPNLCSSFVHYQETKDFRFFSKIIKHFVASLSEAIRACLAGKTPMNWVKRDAEILAEKPREKMGTKERATVMPFDQKLARAEKKLLELEQKASEAAKTGMSWHAFKMANHLARLQSSEQDRLHKLFKPTREPGEGYE